MSGYTHVITYDGGVLVSEIGGGRDISTFSNPLHNFNGDDQWSLGLAPIPPGKKYSDMLKAGELSTQYLQAAGVPDTLTVEIRKPGGKQWGVDSVRYTIGHRRSGAEPLNVPIQLAHGAKMISRAQVFAADEAAELFLSYYRTGDIPDGYELQPVEGYRADGTTVDLSDAAVR
jgi:hypothetical protein